MKLVSLFAGIGGFELAAEAVGWTPVVSCEMNPFGRHTLGHYWPKAYHHDDIHTLTGETVIREITQRFGYYDNNEIIVTGGFPCQPYSTAGKRRGNKDSRHLWPEMLRIIAELKPRHVVGENVLGIVSWDGGLVFEQVCADLENEGYEVQPCVLPAASVNAPHRRDRVWFVAHRDIGSKEPSGEGKAFEADGCKNDDEQEHGRGKAEFHIGSPQLLRAAPGRCLPGWEGFPAVSPIHSGDDGFPGGLAGAAIFGRLHGNSRPSESWARSRHRTESVARHGNAIVPQVAAQVFLGIIKANARYGAATPDLPFGT